MPDKKKVIVTGGSRGIGAAICGSLSSKGFGVMSLVATKPCYLILCIFVRFDGRQ